MKYYSIHRNDWTPFFTLLSKLEAGRWMLLEACGYDFGDQFEKEWKQFDGGISYEEQDNALWVHSMELSHEVIHPVRVLSQEDGVRRAVIIEGEDFLQILHFRDPVLLPGRAEQQE